MPIAYISHSHCLKHQAGQGHPEQPQRLLAIEAALREAGLWSNLDHYQAQPVTEEQILRVHSASHWALLLQQAAAAEQSSLAYLDPDTAMNPFSLDAALYAAGAAVQAVDLLMQGQQKRVFCAVRPPGHHAERHKPMGFCLLNNIAIAAAHALTSYAVERLAIVDFDVHHGNGTQDIFQHESRVLFCSSHQDPFYPYTGQAVAAPHILNVPLAAGVDGNVFRHSIEQECLPHLHHFAPQLLLVSAGFDGHLADPLAQLNLTADDYFWMGTELVKIAQQYCDGRIIASLEGGYDLAALGQSVVAYIQALNDLS